MLILKHFKILKEELKRYLILKRCLNLIKINGFKIIFIKLKKATVN